jgi:hypothetical protein
VSKSQFGFQYCATDSGLTVAVSFDGTEVYRSNATADIQTFLHEFVDDHQPHVLEIQLMGKTTEHTKIDQAGNIISDVTLSLNKLHFDQVDIDLLFSARATYTHNFNGNGPDTVQRFHGVMGCNGTVRLEFSTPIYLWLLENL